jgi:cbb3-type cytochrome oxidase subunit 3
MHDFDDLIFFLLVLLIQLCLILVMWFVRTKSSVV